MIREWLPLARNHCCCCRYFAFLLLLRFSACSYWLSLCRQDFRRSCCLRKFSPWFPPASASCRHATLVFPTAVCPSSVTAPYTPTSILIQSEALKRRKRPVLSWRLWMAGGCRACGKRCMPCFCRSRLFDFFWFRVALERDVAQCRRGRCHRRQCGTHQL